MEGDPSLTHVDHFEEYIEDLDYVVAAVRPRVQEPLSVFCHSMGGAVTGLYLEQHPGVFKKAVMSAPMIAPNRKGLPFSVATLIAEGARALGKSKKRMIMSQPYNGPEDFDTSCASCRERFDWYDAVKQANPAFHNNGPSFSWTGEALKVTAKLLKAGEPEKIDIPVRIYSAEEDNSVLEADQEKFVKRLKNGERIPVKGSRHEIYRSPDAVVFPWWQEVLDFLKG